MIGIAGLDANIRSTAAHQALGIEPARVGVAGLNCQSVIQGACQALDQPFETVAHLREKDRCQGKPGSAWLGDQAASQAWKYACWMVDFPYLVSGGKGPVTWRSGRREFFSRQRRALPLYLDSSGYRREISGNAPAWAHSFEAYIATILLSDPDGFAAWDYPADRQKTLYFLHRMEAIFPQDRRLWPIFSVRWAWDDNLRLDQAPDLPWKAGTDWQSLIPFTSTQRRHRPDVLNAWARLAVANAVKAASDPDLRYMADRFGQVMLGGMAHGPVPRVCRHLYLAVLATLFPGVKIWALGMGSHVVVNGLGMLGMLDRIFLDGTSYLKQAVAARAPVIENGLITMIQLGSPNRTRERQPFFTFNELLASQLRCLLGAYANLWQWPGIAWQDPYAPMVAELANELRPHYQQAQLELGL